MSAFKAKRLDDHDGPGEEKHVRIAVYAGKDVNHLNFSGAIVLARSEVEEFLQRVNLSYVGDYR